ncbi:hypothetical protein RRG08_001371 [Elysia crispata]|uniref:Uncharacterized protein n=1 Tax=Elysia crispata TaxID=231223 RepID=A0AAE0ZYH1_9GAST|nr:hypothetical protein RRG08_001371 [Elysia crispata]
MDNGKDSGRELEGSYHGLMLGFRTGYGWIRQWTAGKIQEGKWKDHTMDSGKVPDGIWNDHTIYSEKDSGRDLEGSYHGQRKKIRAGCGRIIPWIKEKNQDGMWKDHTIDLSLDLGRDLEGSNHGQRERFRTGCGTIKPWIAGKIQEVMWKD